MRGLSRIIAALVVLSSSHLGCGRSGGTEPPDDSSFHPCLLFDTEPVWDEPSGLWYWDDRLDVIARRELSASELAELLQTTGGTIAECQRAAFASAGPVFYRLRAAPRASVADVQLVAAELLADPLVVSAGPTALGIARELITRASDSELEAVRGANRAIEPRVFAPHQMQGAYQYMRVFVDQVQPLEQVKLALIDWGVSSLTHVDELGHTLDGSLAMLEDLVEAGELAVWELTHLAIDDDANRHDGLGYHGSYIANIMGGANNGIYSDELASTRQPLNQRAANGIATGAHGAQITLTSYLSNLDRWLHLPGEDSGGGSDPIVHRRYGGRYAIVSRLLGDYETLAHACKTQQAVNLSVSPPGNAALFDSLPCKETTLFVSASPNAEETGAQYTEVGADWSTFPIENMQGVTTSGDGVLAADPVRKYGPDWIAASSDATSYAAPVIAGAAGLLLQLDPSLTPAQLKHILRTSAVPIPEEPDDFRILDGSAAVLLAIHHNHPDFIPLGTEAMRHVLERTTESLDGKSAAHIGTHEESALWQREGTRLHLGREAIQRVEPASALAGFGATAAGYWSRLESHERYTPRLLVAGDPDHPDRQVPTLELAPYDETMLPQWSQLTGQVVIHYENQDVITPFGPPFSGSGVIDYCHSALGHVSSTTGWRIPLSADARIDQHEVTLSIAGAKLRSYWRRRDGLLANTPLGQPEDAVECGANPLTKYVDNSEQYEAWASQFSGDGQNWYVLENLEEHSYTETVLSDVSCTLTVDGVSTSWDARDVTLAGAAAGVLQVLDVRQHTGAVARCTATATATTRDVSLGRARIMGTETFDYVYVTDWSRTFTVDWDPTDGAFPLTAAIPWDPAFLIEIDQSYMVGRHELPGVGWKRPDLRWAPAIGTVAYPPDDVTAGVRGELRVTRLDHPNR